MTMKATRITTAPIAIAVPGPRTDLVYDFGGFDPRYYSMQYATPDATALGARVAAELGALGPVVQATAQYVKDVQSGAFPGPEQEFK